MRIFGMQKVALAAGFALMLSAVASPAHAVPIGTTGTWDSVTSNSASHLNGVGTGTIAWGAEWYDLSQTATPQSSYNFTGWNTDLLLPGVASAPSYFGLGVFTHNNNVIGGTSITQAILGLSIDIGGVMVNISTPFGHTETLNYPSYYYGTSCAEGGSEPCPDLVKLTGVGITQDLTLDGKSYRLDVSGFFTGDGDGYQSGTGILDRFLTLENESNAAILVGRLSVNRIPVPEPATLGLFAMGMLGMGALARRGRRQAA